MRSHILANAWELSKHYYVWRKPQSCHKIISFLPKSNSWLLFPKNCISQLLSHLVVFPFYGKSIVALNPFRSWLKWVSQTHISGKLADFAKATRNVMFALLAQVKYWNCIFSKVLETKKQDVCYMFAQQKQDVPENKQVHVLQAWCSMPSLLWTFEK